MPSTLPIIGIPCATYARPHPYPLAHGNNETYIRAVEVAGGVPLLIPLVQHEATLLAAFQAVDGLLFAGGVDLDPAYYSEEPHPALGSVNHEQDRVEMQLLAWAKQFHKPVFAICRGFQLLNVAYGGTLYQDLPSQYQPNLNHDESFTRQQRDLPAHGLRLANDSKLAELLGTTPFAVNTMHHQGVKDLGNELQAVGWSDDGLIEAVEDPQRPWVVGVQCHPEEMVRGEDLRWQAIFKAFVEAAKAARNEAIEA